MAVQLAVWVVCFSLVLCTTVVSARPNTSLGAESCNRSLTCQFENNTRCGFEFPQDQNWRLERSTSGYYARFEYVDGISTDLISPAMCNQELHTQFSCLIITNSAVGVYAQMLVLIDCDDKDVHQSSYVVQGPVQSWTNFSVFLPACRAGHVPNVVFRAQFAVPGTVIMLDNVRLHTDTASVFPTRSPPKHSTRKSTSAERTTPRRHTTTSTTGHKVVTTSQTQSPTTTGSAHSQKVTRNRPSPVVTSEIRLSSRNQRVSTSTRPSPATTAIESTSSSSTPGPATTAIESTSSSSTPGPTTTAIERASSSSTHTSPTVSSSVEARSSRPNKATEATTPTSTPVSTLPQEITTSSAQTSTVRTSRRPSQSLMPSLHPFNRSHSSTVVTSPMSSSKLPSAVMGMFTSTSSRSAPKTPSFTPPTDAPSKFSRTVPTPSTPFLKPLTNSPTTSPTRLPLNTALPSVSLNPSRASRTRPPGTVFSTPHNRQANSHAVTRGPSGDNRTTAQVSPSHSSETKKHVIIGVTVGISITVLAVIMAVMVFRRSRIEDKAEDRGSLIKMQLRHSTTSPGYSA